jgi:hypothetical protein
MVVKAHYAIMFCHCYKILKYDPQFQRLFLCVFYYLKRGDIFSGEHAMWNIKHLEQYFGPLSWTTWFE